ncbi:anthocyanidin O-glucosyltransferase [Salix suchowensis]|nr:anthocyanidin O-glucosyltransferase [Salix suchowensis]
MKKAELVFIPTPGISHLVSTVEVAKLLVDRDERLSITFLIMKLLLDPKVDTFIDSVSTACNRIRFIHLSKYEPDPNQPNKSLFSLIESQKPNVKEEVSRLVSRSESSPGSPTLAGFVLDMFCTCMIDVANEFAVPSYIFLTSGAAFLGLQFYVQALQDEQKVDPTEFKGSDAELVMPCLENPLQLSFCLLLCLTKNGCQFSSVQLEVGPMLNLNRDGDRDVESDKFKDIRQWLDDQPPFSVVYLCFGSRGVSVWIR